MSRFSAAVSALAIAAALSACGGQPAGEAPPAGSIELLNVSYDPTRELWRAINGEFIPAYEKEAGVKLTINQSHGGSSTQARAVIDGLDADVVTLALWSDTDAIAKRGLINPGWKDELPNSSLPYTSTIVFVVRKGNPKGIKDWPDLVKPGVEIVTPNPKTSGNGQLSLLQRLGIRRAARRLARGRRSTSSRSSTSRSRCWTPARAARPRRSCRRRSATSTWPGRTKRTWKCGRPAASWSSSIRRSASAPSRTSPSSTRTSIGRRRAPRRKPTCSFLYTEPAQEIIAKHFYRPTNAAVLARHAATFPEMKLFAITEIGKDWDDVHKQLVADGGVFDRIYKPQK